MHANHLEFSNSEAEDNFEIMRVCDLAQSCVLYEVTLGILKLRSRRALSYFQSPQDSLLLRDVYLE